MISYTEKETIFKVENVNLNFGKKVVLRDINFDVKDITRENIKQGQVISIMGRSGIGKSQLFRIMSGLGKPSSGSVKIGADQRPIKSGDVGIVPQNYILFAHRTILKNLMIALNMSKQKLSEKEKLETIHKFAEEFDLIDHLKKFPAQLSGGQKQRTSIVQQILTGNKFILMDEPYSGLDSVMIEKVTNLIIKISLMDEMNTIFIVSHDISNALAVSDLVLILAQESNGVGATITKKIDLKSIGMAWRPDIKKDVSFRELVEEVKTII